MNVSSSRNNPYVQALFALGKEEGCLLHCKEALEKIRIFLQKNPHIVNQFSNPFLNKKHHLKGLKPILAGLPLYVANFINLLAQNKRLPLLPDLIKGFDALYIKEAGILTAHIQTATPFSTSEKGDLQKKLAALSKRNPSQILLEITENPSLSAGFRIYMPPYFVDASLESYLHKLECIANESFSA